MDDSAKSPRISKKKIYVNGTALGLIISIPAIVAYLLSYTLTENFLLSLTVSAITFFALTGFSVKLSKKLMR